MTRRLGYERPVTRRTVFLGAVATAPPMLGSNRAEQSYHAPIERIRRSAGASEELASAAHQLRTPLTAVLAYAEMLLHDDIWEDSTKRGEIIGHIVANAVIQSRISTSGSTAARSDGTSSLLQLRREVEELFVDIEPALGSNELEVDVRPDVFVTAEKVALREILTNLAHERIDVRRDGRPYPCELGHRTTAM